MTRPLPSWLNLLLLVMLTASSVRAEPVEGVDYRRVAQPPPRGVAKTIQIVEFFAYGCRSCYEFQPRLDEWIAELPEDVTFSRIPVTFRRPQWEALARAYYTLQFTGDLQRLDQALFDAIHVERQRLFDETSLAQWAALHGVDRELFVSTYQSASVSEQVASAAQQARQYQIAMTPTLVINGEYVVLVRSLDQLLDTAQQLVRQLRTAPAQEAPAAGQ